VTKFWKSEAGALVGYFFGVVLLGALVMPWLFRGGIELGRLAQAGEVGGVLRSIGESSLNAAEKGKISRFFARALMLATLVLLPLLLMRLRQTRTAGAGLALDRLRPWPRVLLHFGTGVVVAAGILWLVAGVLTAAGAFVPAADGYSLGKLLKSAALPALGTAVVGEWLFRGLIVGVWLRAQSAWAAILGSSLLFAAVHPLPGLSLPDPGAPTAGFEFLGAVISRYADPQVFIAELLTLFSLGVLLAWTRVRTRSLWLPIGLHAGIVFAFKAFNIGHERVAAGPVSPWLVGDDLRAGLVPLASLALMAIVLHALIRWDRRRAA
jgi:membrane protease YdiL (CAAX protease family)